MRATSSSKRGLSCGQAEVSTPSRRLGDVGGSGRIETALSPGFSLGQ